MTYFGKAEFARERGGSTRELLGSRLLFLTNDEYTLLFRTARARKNVLIFRVSLLYVPLPFLASLQRECNHCNFTRRSRKKRPVLGAESSTCQASLAFYLNRTYVHLLGH